MNREIWSSRQISFRGVTSSRSTANGIPRRSFILHPYIYTYVYISHHIYYCNRNVSPDYGLWDLNDGSVYNQSTLYKWTAAAAATHWISLKTITKSYPGEKRTLFLSSPTIDVIASKRAKQVRFRCFGGFKSTIHPSINLSLCITHFASSSSKEGLKKVPSIERTFADGLKTRDTPRRASYGPLVGAQIVTRLSRTGGNTPSLIRSKRQARIVAGFNLEEEEEEKKERK